jgi:hypothetical protein
MPRYFFDIKDGAPQLDSLGEDLADDADAWKVALRIAREMEHVLVPGGIWEVEVRRDVPVFRIQIKAEQLAVPERR